MSTGDAAMAPGEDPDPPVERLAAERLGVGLGATSREVRSTLFRRLRDADFLPDPSVHEAMLILSGREAGPLLHLAEDVARAEEARLREVVEDFASHFFATPVPDRRERWRSLFQACAAHDRLLRRLKDLQPGLIVDQARLSDRSPTVNRLRSAILEFFVLRPGPRAESRRRWLQELQADATLNASDLARARKRLMRVYPSVAVLSHGLLLQLAQPRRSLEANRRRARIAAWFRTDLEKQMSLRPEIVFGSFGFAMTVLFVFCLFLSNFIFVPAPARTTPSVTFPAPLMPPPPVFHTASIQPPSPQFIRYFHDAFKAPIRRELEKIGQSLDDTQLQQVVDALPADVGSNYGGMAIIRLMGLWTDKEYDRYVAALTAELAHFVDELDEKQLREVARKCFPKPDRALGKARASPGAG